MIRISLGFMLLFAVAVDAAPSQTTVRASNGLLAAFNGSQIEVFSRPGTVGAEYFCAAGEVAHGRLAATDRDTLTLTRAVSRSATRQGRRSVSFTLGPPTADRAFQALVLWPYRTGDRLRVWVAVSLCGDGPGRGQN